MKIGNYKLKINSQSGHALVSLIFISFISVTIASAAIVILGIQILASSDHELGTRAYFLAETGVENSLLRLLRDPDYTGETLVTSGGTATTTVVGEDPTVITSVGEVGDFKRVIEVEIEYTNGMYSVVSWKEVAS